MAMSQQTVVTTNQPQQPAVVIQPTLAPVTPPAARAHLRKLFGIGISEIVLGSLCVILGAAVTGIVGERSYYYFPINQFSHSGFIRYIRVKLFTTGEGMWCGVWIIVAGALALCSSKPHASRCLITTHMAFSIVGAIFTVPLFIISVFAAIPAARLDRYYGEASVLALQCILCILAFTTLILQILGAAYSCAAVGCCGEQGCCRGGNEACCNNQGCDCCMPYPDNVSYGGARVTYIQPSAMGGQPMMYMQPSAMGGQQVVVAQPPASGGVAYLQQPVGGGQQIAYVQQPAGAGKPVIYTQQPVMAFQGATNAPQGNVMPGGGVQPSPQPGFRNAAFQPNQTVNLDPDNSSAVAPTNKTAPPGYEPMS